MRRLSALCDSWGLSVPLRPVDTEPKAAIFANPDHLPIPKPAQHASPPLAAEKRVKDAWEKTTGPERMPVIIYREIWSVNPSPVTCRGNSADWRLENPDRD